jgi:pimeloyl-ACP methyl ester carboxylesterase
MSTQALAVIRPFVKLGSRFAPRLTGNAAFRVFCRPPQPKGIDDAQRALTERAEARLATAVAERVSFDGGEVQTYRFVSEAADRRGTVLLIHGWTGRAAFMLGFVEPLLKSGFDVLAVDLPAHGRSAGRELHVPLAVRALRSVCQKAGPIEAVIAHSFGGAVALGLVSGSVKGMPAVPVKKLVFISVPHSMAGIFRGFGNFIGLGERAQFHLEENVPRLFGKRLDEIEGRDMLERLGLPTLVMHAPDDKEVAFASAEAFAAAGDHVILQPMPGLGHRRILYAPSTIKSALAFIAAVDEEQAA